MDVVDRIFDLIEKKGIEQKEFAIAVGSHPSKVSEWKSRKSKSYQKRITQIATYLGTSVEYLMTGKEKEPTVPKDGEPVNTITFNRNGKVIRKQYSKETWDTIIKMLDAIPEDRLP